MTIACGIDLGTNSFRLLVAEVRDGRIVPLRQELATVRLGQGLAASGSMTPEAMARGIEALRGFSEAVAKLHPQRLRICATHALRVAKNRSTFLEAAAAILHAVVEVISPAEEATLSLAGAQHVLGHTAPMALADVGGGSSELVWRGQANAIETISVAAGAVSLTEGFLPDPAPAEPRSLAALRNTIGALFAGHAIPCLPLVGSGGTATACAALDLGLTVYDAKLVQGHRLTLPRLRGMIASLAGLDRESRNRLPGMDQGRGEIMLAGALIYEHLLVRATQETLTVSDAGLLEGILLSSLGVVPR